MIQAILLQQFTKVGFVLSFYLQRTQTSERFSSHELPKSDLITSEYVTPQTATGMKKCQKSKIAQVLFTLAITIFLVVQTELHIHFCIRFFPHFFSSVLSPHWKRLRREDEESEVEWMRSSKVVVVVDVDVSSGKILISGSG